MDIKHEKFFPYNVGRIEIVRNRKPYAFHIVLREEDKYTPGILEKIVEIFAKNEIPILQLKTSVVREEQRIVIFADMTGREGMVEDIKNRISESLRVRGVDVAGPLFDGVAMDVWSHPLIIGVHRGIMMTEHMYRGFFKMGWERLGEVFGTFLLTIGVDTGREFYAGVSRLAPRLHQPEHAGEMLRLLGFGVFKWVHLSKNRVVVDVYDSFECGLYRGEESGQPMGFFVMGLLKGWLSGYWGVEPREIESRETKCIVLGDGFCRFEFGL